MRFNHLMVAMLVVGLFGVSAGFANPVLLASYVYHVEGGGASDHPANEPWTVSFISQLGFYDWEPFPQVRALGGDVRWGDGDAGSVEFTSDNSGAFEDFAGYATNGVEDQIRFWNLDGLGGNGSPFASESQVFNGDPDFIGHRLTMVRLTVTSLHFESWIPEWSPDLEGFRYSGNTAWQFFGVAVPEPSGMILALAVACAIPLRSERRRRGR